MAKELTKFELAIKQADESAELTNKKIDELGLPLNNLYDCLAIIQVLFKRMGGVPDEIKETTTKLEKLRVEWKQLAENIEAQYNKTVTSTAGAGAAGVSAGVGVALLGPTAAMSIATTFGVASTGTAIASLSGAAATKAALAWLAGGALVAGGGGIAGGSTLLALAGPIGWGLAATSLAVCATVYLVKQRDKEQLENIFIHIKNRDIKKNRLAVEEINSRLNLIKHDIEKLKDAIMVIKTLGTDYSKLTKEQKLLLGTYINIMESSTMLLINPIKWLQPYVSEEYFNNFKFDAKANKHKNVIISLANLLENIVLEESYKKLLAEALVNNSDYMTSFQLTKKEINSTDFVTFINNALVLTNNKQSA